MNSALPIADKLHRIDGACVSSFDTESVMGAFREHGK